MDRPKLTRGLAAVLLAGALMAGCASTADVDLTILTSNSAQQIWAAGQKSLEDKAYETARRYFRRIIDGFPQSELVPAARMAAADSYFAEGGEANYILAVAAYREFLTFYPSHARADYAQFQVAESYFRQRNPPDRDQTATRQALEEYQRLLELYPRSESIETARERIVACRQSLAEASFRIGNFYQRTRKACRAAISRYEEVLRDYPDYANLDEVLFRLGECLVQRERPAEALPRLQELLDEYPDSAFAEQARQLQAVAAAEVETPPHEAAGSSEETPPAGSDAGSVPDPPG